LEFSLNLPPINQNFPSQYWKKPPIIRHWNNGDRSSPVASVASGGVLWPVKPGQYKGLVLYNNEFSHLTLKDCKDCAD